MEFPPKRDTDLPDRQDNSCGPKGRLLSSRRWTLSMFAIGCLTTLGIHNSLDTSMAIASVAAALSAANSYQKKNPPQ